MVEQNKIDDTLKRLVLSQRREIEHGQPEYINPTNHYIVMFSQLVLTRAFGKLYHTAAVRFSQPEKVNPNEVGGHFAGALYQKLIYLLHASTKRGAATLFSSGRTLDFYKVLHPDKEPINHPFGLTSLMGISVPDMLTIREQTGSEKAFSVEEVHEVTLNNHFDRLDKKSRALRLDSVLYPSLFSRTRLVTYIPMTGNEVIDRELKEYFSTNGIENITPSFSLTDFNEFMRFVVCEYRSEKGKPTLSEIQQSCRRPKFIIVPNPSEEALGDCVSSIIY